MNVDVVKDTDEEDREARRRTRFLLGGSGLVLLEESDLEGVLLHGNSYQGN